MARRLNSAIELTRMLWVICTCGGVGDAMLVDVWGSLAYTLGRVCAELTSTSMMILVPNVQQRSVSGGVCVLSGSVYFTMEKN